MKKKGDRDPSSPLIYCTHDVLPSLPSSLSPLLVCWSLKARGAFQGFFKAFQMPGIDSNNNNKRFWGTCSCHCSGCVFVYIKVRMCGVLLPRHTSLLFLPDYTPLITHYCNLSTTLPPFSDHQLKVPHKKRGNGQRDGEGRDRGCCYIYIHSLHTNSRASMKKKGNEVYFRGCHMFASSP